MWTVQETPVIKEENYKIGKNKAEQTKYKVWKQLSEILSRGSLSMAGPASMAERESASPHQQPKVGLQDD